MTVGELRKVLYDVVKQYFVGAAVKWTNENSTKPAGPLVTLQLGNVRRELFSIVENRQGHPVKLYHSHAMLDINLYTPGGMGKAVPGMRPRVENTAVNDMQDFMSYMDSDYAMALLDAADVTVLPEGPTMDVSELIDSTQYEYRAMQQFTVEFIQNAAGVAGIVHIPARPASGNPPVDPGGEPDPPDNPDNPIDTPEEILPDSSTWEQTSSGGGSRELAGMDTGWFEAAETEEIKE